MGSPLRCRLLYSPARPRMRTAQLGIHATVVADQISTRLVRDEGIQVRGGHVSLPREACWPGWSGARASALRIAHVADCQRNAQPGPAPRKVKGYRRLRQPGGCRAAGWKIENGVSTPSPAAAKSSSQIPAMAKTAPPTCSPSPCTPYSTASAISGATSASASRPAAAPPCTCRR